MTHRFGITQVAPKGAVVPQWEIDGMLGFVGIIELPGGGIQSIKTTEAFSVKDDDGNMLGITTWADFLD